MGFTPVLLPRNTLQVLPTGHQWTTLPYLQVSIGHPLEVLGMTKYDPINLYEALVVLMGRTKETHRSVGATVGAGTHHV